MPFRLPRSVRSVGRLQAIARVLTRHGFGHLVERLNLVRYVPFGRLRRAVKPVDVSETPSSIGRRLVMVCEELGPTYIKLGQMVSTRPDLLPGPVIEQLRRLQDHVAPFDSAQAKRIIADDLGAPVEQCFPDMDDEPFASGSIAQTYHARTGDGQRVVVKVKRPEIERVIRLDMHILRWIAETVERAMPEIAAYRPRMIVDEFERTIGREMDFLNEASATSRFAEAFHADPTMRVPQVRWDLSGPRVLTLEDLPGVSIYRMLEGTTDVRIDRDLVARNLVKAFLKQFFELGMFHADPHPGNLLISAPARIGLIDFGMVGQVDDELAGQMVIGLIAAVNKQVDVVIDVLADVGALGADSDRAELRRGLRELLDKYYGLPLKRLDMQTIFIEVTDLMRRHNVTVPRDFVLLGKSLVTVGGVALQLDPDLNLVEAIRPRIGEMLTKQFSADRVAKTIGLSIWHTLNILKNAPGQVRDVMRRLARGQWQVNVRHRNLDYLASELDRSSNRLAFSIVIAAIIIGSSWTITSDREIGLIPLSALGIIGYLFAGIMGLWLVVAILRSGRMS